MDGRPHLPVGFATAWLAQAHEERVTDDDKIVVPIVMRSAHSSKVLLKAL
jgi:hypothetical protein